jgi:predicted DNA-binding ribbon-helix-helix protein
MAKLKHKEVRRSIRIPQPLYDQLRSQAKAARLSIAAVIHLALLSYIWKKP